MSFSTQDSSRFSHLTVAIHWASVLLVLSAFALAWLRSMFEDSGWEDAALIVHRQMGLSVMALLVLRLVVRWFSGSGQFSPVTWNWLDLLAMLSHWTLYTLLAVLPLLGWAMTNAQGHEVFFWAMVPLPDLIAIDPDWADTLQEWHERVGVLLFLLITLHAAAALIHHYVLKDEVLTGMLPVRKKRSASNTPH